MLDVKKKGSQWNITITKGDSGYLEIVPTDKEGAPLELVDGDVVHAQVRDQDDQLLFEADISKETAEDGTDVYVWHIHPSDTKNAEIGTYVWDAQIEYGGEDEDVTTFIGLSDFNIIKESTRRS